MRDRDRPLAAPAENADAAIGQLPLDRSQREAAVDSVEHAMKYPRGRPRQQPRQPPTRANCPVLAQQFVAPPGPAMRVHSLFQIGSASCMERVCKLRLTLGCT